MTEERPFTKLFRESGLLDKHMEEFKRWRLVEDVEGGNTPEQSLEQLVHDIADMLEREPALPQTVLTPNHQSAPTRWMAECPHLVEVMATTDELGRLMVTPIPDDLALGQLIRNPFGHSYLIVDMDKIYEGENPASLLLTVEEQ